MAVKFSEFQAKQDASVDVTEVVGYLTSGELNVRIPPANLDTTYAVSTGNAGASPTISLQGTKPGQAAAITPSTVSLTGLGGTVLVGDGSTAISFTSTTYDLTATDTSPAGTVPLVLGKTGGGDLSGDNIVNLIGAGGIGITSSSNTVTITGAGGGGVTSFTNTNGTFVSAATANSAATGAVTTGVIDLSATGTPSASNFLRGDNTWATPPSGTGTVTSVGTTTTGIAALTLSGTVTTSGDLDLAKTGGTGGQYIDGAAGAWTTLPAGYTSWNLTGDSGTTEAIADGNTVDVAGGTDITTVASSADTLTVNHAAITRTDTTSADAPAAGASVDLVKTISTSAQGHVTAIDVSTVTWPAGGGGFGSINQTTGTGSSLGAITLGSTPAAAFNCLISISGVTQNYLDAAGTPNWTVSTNTLTFAFNPPVTATNGIQIIVIA